MMPKSLVRAVLERDGYQCMIAGPDCTGEASVADHRANGGHGGSKVLHNPACLVAACGVCNGWKETVHGAVLIELKRRGIRVPKASTNAATVSRCLGAPVEDPGGQGWWLREDGRRDRAEWTGAPHDR